MTLFGKMASLSYNKGTDRPFFSGWREVEVRWGGGFQVEEGGFQVEEGGFQVEREWGGVRLRFFRWREMGVGCQRMTRIAVLNFPTSCRQRLGH